MLLNKHQSGPQDRAAILELQQRIAALTGQAHHGIALVAMCNHLQQLALDNPCCTPTVAATVMSMGARLQVQAISRPYPPIVSPIPKPN